MLDFFFKPRAARKMVTPEQYHMVQTWHEESRREVEQLTSQLEQQSKILSEDDQLRKEVSQLSALVDLQGQQIAALKLDLEELNRRQQSPAPQPPKRTTKKKVEGDS